MSKKSHVINAFLNGSRLWEEGLPLYLKYGKNAAYRTLFEQIGETPYNYEKLLEGLENIVLEPLAGGADAIRKSAARREKSTARRTATARPSVAPASIKKLYKERAHLHAQLMLLESDDERKENAFRIIEISKQIDNHFQIREKN